MAADEALRNQVGDVLVPTDETFVDPEDEYEVWRFMRFLDEEFTPDVDLRQIAYMHHCEGWTPEEVAVQLGVSRAKVYRDLKLIKRKVERFARSE